MKICKTWNKEKLVTENPTRWHYPLINYFNQTQVLAYQNFKNKTPAVWHRCHTPFIRHHIFNSIPVILPNGWKIYWGFYTFRVSRLHKIDWFFKVHTIWKGRKSLKKNSPNSIWCFIFKFFGLLRIYKHYSTLFHLFEIFSSPAEIKRVKFTFFT